MTFRHLAKVNERIITIIIINNCTFPFCCNIPETKVCAEKAVNVQLQQYLNQHGLLNSFQQGFRRYHSTQTYFCDTIRRSTDAGKLTGALFIDLRKAFDTIPHDDLISKLKRFGMEENSLAWLTRSLTEVRLFVSKMNYPVQCLSLVAYHKVASLAPYCSSYI